eukprot:CAMPEP_0180541058 /NCGR_PEP_ID=MMETSP1036_2-20121128/67741_1 /TAXON_ID=632150 /ORGANISM="Azadinium spinosum, Strain 3D9" /LENGTH=68 /DNA_ID=CAMNT_0022555883 /DNA_START=522 /DNA_END=725 /DNA_ORIENTATION=+
MEEKVYVAVAMWLRGDLVGRGHGEPGRAVGQGRHLLLHQDLDLRRHQAEVGLLLQQGSNAVVGVGARH